MLALQEKTWEDNINKLNPEDKDYKKAVENYKEIKEEQKKTVEKMKLAQKMGMKEEKDIYETYMKKNQKNRERQEKNY
ncbi:4985_t:CDS:2 [Entrophospora sp. SA101]|nr:9161_t:CDS:2 [Entrophospora sp. SA101]CAJ0833569.1 4985_t:CDS:2 [Entrophospora sp. SA101]